MELPESFMRRIQVDPVTGCWEWTGSRNEFGYGKVQMRKYWPAPMLTHRVAYLLLVGPVPDGLVLDHLCRNRACANVAHLEPVTRGVNTNRGDMRNRGIRNREKTHCKQGHPYDAVNTLHPDKTRPAKRVCRECRNANSRRWYWKQSA